MTRRTKNTDPGEQLVRPKSKVTDLTGAADYLGITERHLRELVYRRKIAYTKAGRLLRFYVEDLDKYLRDNRVEAAS